MGKWVLKWIILAGLPLLLAEGHAWGLLLVVVATEAVLYGYSLWRRPWVPCPMCHGGGTSTHSGLLALLWPSAFGACVLCRGRKGKVRLGVRLLSRERAERVKPR